MTLGRLKSLVICLLGVGAVPLWTCCTPAYHKKDADREVYRILEKVRKRQVGMRALFTIEPAAEPPLVALRRWHEARTLAAKGPGPSEGVPKVEDFPDGLPRQEGTIRLTLSDALELAARYSREYQTEKENLYLAALALTLERYNWKPSFFATFAGTVTKDKTGKVAVDDLRGATEGEKRTAKAAAKAMGPGADTSVYNDAKTKTGVSARFAKTKSLTTDVGFTQLLATGGDFTIRLTTDLMRATTADPREAIGSVLTAEVVQPLLRGGGRLVARENLTQAERDTVYAVRSFARFRRTFVVNITSRYYRVLQQRDSVVNAWDNYQRLRQARARSADMANAGRLAEFEVDKARQEVLRARDSWVQALRQYQEQLDNFKITLGLPTEAAIALDPTEIDALRKAGPGPVKLTRERAVAIALERRLDLLNVNDQVRDGERLVKIARNGLAPDLAARLGVSVASRERSRLVPVLDETGAEVGSVTVVDRRRPTRFSMHRGVFTAGVEGELPLDRKAERNAYRGALINLERARRAATETEDQVTLSVRQAWRSLLEAAESYKIQLAAVPLAERRVESTSILLQRGDADMDAVLRANDDLVDAQNALTRALIDHRLARLALWRDTELLRVDEHGVWQDMDYED